MVMVIILAIFSFHSETFIGKTDGRRVSEQNEHKNLLTSEVTIDIESNLVEVIRGTRVVPLPGP